MQAPLKSVLDRPGYTRWRKTKDRLAAWCIAVCGLSVTSAVLLILVYLLWEVVPLFAKADGVATGQVSMADEEVIWLDTDEQESVMASLDRSGRFGFFHLEQQAALQTPPASHSGIAALAANAAEGHQVALAHDDGTLSIFAPQYRIRFEGSQRVVEPALEHPYGAGPLGLESTAPARHLAYADDDARLTLVRALPDHSLVVDRLTKEQSFLTGQVTLAGQSWRVDASEDPVSALEISGDQRWLFVARGAGTLQFYSLSDAVPALISQRQQGNTEITASAVLSGGVSLLLGDASGGITQLFPVRDADNRYQLATIRQFRVADAPVALIVPEERRKGFLAFDDNGRAALFHATAHRRLLGAQLANSAPTAARISPRASALLMNSRGEGTAIWQLDNEHPEISWSGIWGRVWYENYAEPRFIWQSSAANNDFESKFSLTPLAFGTLKAAFYAMLVAVPLALAGALFTAYFMAPSMRQSVKPTIEIMEALPTVILGFLAGLWLAPMLEQHLASFFAVLIVMAPGIVLFGWLYSRLPVQFRSVVQGGWHAAVLIPVVILLAVFGWLLGDPLQNLLFGGDMREWISREMGVTYDQRNAMVVGIAMGFAVIPTIFSIAEDAIFSVPKSLAQGSLALGATPWQTATRVILPTASPGIFSALMIGLGRAVGETMIVLMATGNTPIMDFNLFEGMRTLAANIAVEMPESEVNSTHYRVLFAAALVLFAFTFVVNTVAEIVRQRLRERYSSL